MSDSVDPGALRSRAGALRALARRLDASVIGDLTAAAGDDTWRGPTAEAFRADARRAERLRDDAVATLAAAARALEQAAGEATRAR